MRKIGWLLWWIFLLSLVLPAPPIRNYFHSFFGVYGRQAAAMGRVDGSAFEIWVYPFKVLHELGFRVVVDDTPEDPYRRVAAFDFSAAAFNREFVGEKWKISETVYPHYEEPLVFIVYRVFALTGLDLEFSFKPDLSPMWPGALGGKYSYWDKRKYFVLSESSGRNHAFFGGFVGRKIGQLPAHKLPGGKLRCRIHVEKGFHEISLVATAGRGTFQAIHRKFAGAKDTFEPVLRHREQQLRAYKENHLQVITPEPLFNEALDWAILQLNAAFVRSPDLGEGLVAGYGLSYEGERPGFGWYFGGDGLINGLALVNIGDFAGARQEIEFLLKYQRQDGKIMHELSQGAGFVDWFEDYGFPFFHGDTTLYFAAALDFYLKRSGDIQLLKQYRGQIDKVFGWLARCDADGDGIVETGLAGAGASETGPLRQKMKTDIYLAALSVRAWQAMADVTSLLADTRKVKTARKRLAASRRALDRLFWNEERQFYMYAVRADGSQIRETTVWPAVGLRFRVMEGQRAQSVQRVLASPELSADWGSRFLSSKSGYYDPSSYNNGAVWPFLTGFTALALYNCGNPYHGYSLLQANLHIVMDFDYGAPTELLSGDIYRPLDQSVPNQIWSAGNTLSAFVEGLLGFDADAIKKEIHLEPALPLHWEHITVTNLKAGTGQIRFQMKRLRNRLAYEFDFEDLAGYTFVFAPRIPCLRRSFLVDNIATAELAPLKIEQHKKTLHILLDMSGYLYPFVKKDLRSGAPSSQPIIQDLLLKPDTFSLTLWARGETFLYLFTDLDFTVPFGTLQQEGLLHKWTLPYPQEWHQKTLTCPLH